MKLSVRQREVLQRLADGWELGHGGGLNGGYWLRKNGLGRGGETKEVHASTASSLWRRKLIRGYKITDAGRAALEGVR